MKVNLNRSVTSEWCALNRALINATDRVVTRSVFSQYIFMIQGAKQSHKNVNTMAERLEPYLEIRELTKNFGNFIALQEISFEVQTGEFVCFLGPSGCGKTTLLRVIAGLEPQTTGRVIQQGRDISRLPPAARDFGIVFQSYALFPNLTTTENIAYGLVNQKLTTMQINTRVNELIDWVDLGEQRNQYPAQLSGGQQQRVALARAIAISPGLLLLDEPLAALDAKVRVLLRKEIKQLQHRLKVTTIMVTHDQEEALTMADRMVVMNHGVIEQIGSPAEIYHQPATRFVANFIGTMNFIPAEVVADYRLKIGDYILHCPAIPPHLGKQVTASIRAENIVFGDVNDNKIEVCIERLEFLGAYIRAELSCQTAANIRLYADFSSDLVKREQLVEKKSISVALPAKSIRLYPS